MSKLQRKWIRLNYSDPGALRAEDIPYDASKSAKDAIIDAGKTLRISSTDTTSGFLQDKIVAGVGVSLQITNIGADERLQLDSTQVLFETEVFILDATDIANKQIALTYTPISVDNLNVEVVGAPVTDRQSDWALINTNIITWAGKNLENILEVGDKLLVTYNRMVTAIDPTWGLRNVFVNDDYSATVGSRVIFDTTSKSFTVTLPPNPAQGDQLWFVDGAGLADVNNLIINPNGKNVNGQADYIVIDVANASFGLLYKDDTRGWIFT